MSRRGRALLVGALAGTLALTGACSSSSSGGGSSSSGAGHLTVWSQWLVGQPGQKFMQSAIKDFEQQTGIKVSVQWKGNAIATALVPALNTSSVPTDVVETSASQIENTLYPTGGMLDLSAAYTTPVPGTQETVGQVIGAQATSLATPVNATGALSGGPVVMPYWASATGIVFYNGTKFPALVSDPPTDWDAFFTVLDAQRAKGKRPIAQDGSVTSYNAMFYNNFLSSIMGQHALTAAESDRTGKTWEQPGYLQAAQLVQKLAHGGYFISGYDASKYPAMEDDWANNQASFNVNGSWLPSEVAPVAEPGFDYQSFAFPAVSGHAAPMLSVGVSGIGILKKSKNQAAAEKFAAFLLQPKYQQQVASTMQDIPIQKGAAAPAPIEKIKQAIDAGQISTDRAPESLADYNTKIYFPLDDQLIFGKIDATKFISELSSQSADYWKSQS